ncbi:MAG: hypothetical protein FWC97_11835 [Treponema sp.]|nr:hypothetical protein [Treponema sp.]
MTITQTVEIPANRRLTIEIPREVPTGRTDVIIQFPVHRDTQPLAAPKTKKSALVDSLPRDSNGKIRLTKSIVDEMLADKTLLSLTGILRTDLTVDEIREERLAKYLK